MDYLENISKNSKMKFNNTDVRNWYVDTTKQIHKMVDSKTRQMLDSKHKNLSFEERILDKMERKGLTRAEAIQDIYETAIKTNKNVNREFGITDEQRT